MRARDIPKRLTGISTPFGGAAWAPRPTDTELARRLLTALEDRRVLYVPWEAELPRHCVDSVQDIRARTTDLIGDAAGRQPLTDQLRGIRAACRKFLDQIGPDLGQQVQPFRGGTNEWVFNQALGELRGVVGVHIALLADHYSLDVEDQLAQILPLPDDDPGWLLSPLDDA